MAKERKVRFTYQVLNIKLISDLRRGTDAYLRIFEDIFSNTISKPTSRGKVVIIRTMFPGSYDGKKFFYGKIARFTALENDKWLNISTKEIEKPELDKNLFPNLQETEYVFVPQAHRFLLKKSPDFTIYNAEDFFNRAIKDVIGSTEDYNVFIEQDKDIFEEIYSAIRVERLEVTISYTNSDNIDDDAGEWMDEELKEAKAKKAVLLFEGEKNEGINIDTKLIKGALELAAENGQAEARVLGRDNRIKKIITKRHPKEVKTQAENEEQVKNVMFIEIMNKYRNGGNK